MKNFADWLFRKFCNPDYYDDIRGDLEELYYNLSQKHATQKANLLYLKEILLLFRWSLLKPISKPTFFNHYFLFNSSMLKSYFLLGIRHLKKNKLISGFNLLGLSFAIACSIVIFIFLEFEYTVDHFHKDHERIFLAGFSKNEGGKVRTYGYVPEAIGNILATEYAKVEQTVITKRSNGVVQYKDNDPFYERITFTDETYLQVFNFPLYEGNIEELSDPSKVIISQPMAEKYFGDTDPIGEVLQLTIGENESFELIVGGIAEKFPHKRGFAFSFLVNIALWENMNAERDPWLSYNAATFIKTKSTSDIFEIREQLDKQLPIFAQKRDEYIEGKFEFISLSKLSLETYKIRNDISQGHGNDSGRLTFAIIGILLLTIACLNYINTATAQGARRIKEIGVRKVIGGKKSSIISQFLMENLVLNLLALAIGSVVAYLFLLPAFNNLFSFNLQFEWDNRTFWLFALATLFITTILSGAYPAFYLSKFQPSEILKGDKQIKFKNTFSKIFLTVQFIITFIYIVVGLLFTANTSYQQGKEIGYQANDVVVIKPKDDTAYNFLKTELQKNNLVESITNADNHVAYRWETKDFEFKDIKNETIIHTVSDDYLEKLAFTILKGKVPQLGDNSEIDEVIVNETFVHTLNTTDVLGQEIKIEDKRFFIAGVVKDFHFMNFNHEIQPVLFKIKNSDTYPYLLAKVSKDNGKEVLEEVQQLWKKVTPSFPFNGYIQYHVYDSYFNYMKGVNSVIVFSSLLAVLLSCTGLFGLVYLNLTSRLKDYSIMKVMGASSYDLSKQVLRIFIAFLVIAIVLGFPVSLYVSKVMFGVVFNNHIPINALYPTFSAIFLLIISFTTISALILKISKQNPVVALRNS